jgi:hypothetical protein
MMSEVTALPRNIRSQLSACQRKPGIWSGCPPEQRIDADLKYMLDAKLVQWSPRHGGYVITERGVEALTPSPASR